MFVDYDEYYLVTMKKLARFIPGVLTISEQDVDWLEYMPSAIDRLSAHVHAVNVDAGWWTDLRTGEDLHGKRNDGEMMALLHSEISEALEAHRSNLDDAKIPYRRGLEVEMADGLLRLLDTAGAHRFDLGAAFSDSYVVDMLRFRRGQNVGECLSLIHLQIGIASFSALCKDSASYSTSLGRVFRGILNFGAANSLDLAGAMIDKMEFNRTRLDHAPSQRISAGGKRF